MTRFLTAVMCGLAATAAAADPAPTDAERRSEAVTLLGKAARLAAFGRGETSDETGLKDLKSPEALVAAGGMLLRAQAVLGGEFAALDPKADVGAKSPTLKDEAAGLFDEARALAAADKSKAAAVEALIKQAEKVGETRGAVGKPRRHTRTLQPGESHTYTIPFEEAAQASVTVTSVGPAATVEITAPGGNGLFNETGRTLTHTWTTARAKNADARVITITVSNNKKNPLTFTITTN